MKHYIKDIVVGNIFHLNRYYVQLNIMSNIGEYSSPMGFKYIENLEWIENKEEIFKLIEDNNGKKYSDNCDSICFVNKKEAQTVVDKLLSLYQLYVICNK